MTIDLFNPVVPENRLHPAFRGMAHRGFEPARRVLENIAATFNDKDGNFVKDFQTTGFDARLWELYLHVYLQTEGFSLDDTEAVPDFIATKGLQTISIEATTVNATQAKEATEAEAEAEASGLAGWDLFSHRMHNVYPIKFGSPLFSKLRKRYWELGHVSGRPLVLAIEDFQDSGSMVWTGTALQLYLYGYDYTWYREVSGKLVLLPEPIGDHRDGTKKIPSGFFDLPDTEHISAVLFSNSATISKFNRMGFLEGYRPENLSMLRFGTCYNHEPHATEPLMFKYIVGTESAPMETWKEGLSMFHNPKASVPVPEDLFSGIAHHRLNDQNQMQSTIPEFHPYGSLTQIFNNASDTTAVPPISPSMMNMLSGDPPVNSSEKIPVGIRQISRAEFRSHKLANGPVAAPVIEKSWFADDSGLLGTVFKDVTDQDWNYVVLSPDIEGLYRWIAGNSCMKTQEEAERALIAEMSNQKAKL